MSQAETIAAIATAPGEGAIGIVRMTGPSALSVLVSLFRTQGGATVTEEYFPSHLMRYGSVVEPLSGEALDEVLAVCMRGPKSYTREDVVEVHGHGGTAALRRILHAVLEAGVRLAEPGEFTRRAYLNGRLELHQAEAVIDVIRARTDRALSAALASLGGAAGKKIEEIRGAAIELAARVEAWIDFPEEDIPPADQEDLLTRCGAVRREIEFVLGTFREGRVLREGLSVAIVGRPNVGKSSLLNALLREDRAIVTETPGTTRDTIEENWSAGGIPLRLVDTAGIRDVEDRVEAEGVRRSRVALDEADLVILVLDASESLEERDAGLLKEMSERRGMVVLNKSDLPARLGENDLDLRVSVARPVIATSAKRGEGIDAVRAAIETIALGDAGRRETPLISRARHRGALERARTHLEDFATGVREGRAPELLAVDLRDGLDAIGEIVGVAVADDILDVIFGEFCIGK